jgi:hypothetical protein
MPRVPPPPKPTPLDCRVLLDDLILMELLQVLKYKGKLSFARIRWNIYIWTVRPSWLMGKHFSTFVYRNELYIVRVK